MVSGHVEWKLAWRTKLAVAPEGTTALPVKTLLVAERLMLRGNFSPRRSL